MPLTNPSNANNLNFTPGGTIGADKVQAAILEAAAEALQKSNNLSDLANASAAWSNLGAAQSLGANGWQKLPSGLIIQWRTFTGSNQVLNANTYYTSVITFPIAFNSVYVAVGCQIGGLGAGMSHSFEGLNNSQVSAVTICTNTITTTLSFRVIAIGI